MPGWLLRFFIAGRYAYIPFTGTVCCLLLFYLLIINPFPAYLQHTYNSQRQSFFWAKNVRILMTRLIFCNRPMHLWPLCYIFAQHVSIPSGIMFRGYFQIIQKILTVLLSFCHAMKWPVFYKEFSQFKLQKFVLQGKTIQGVMLNSKNVTQRLP
jgi:hypothetical protein